MSSTTTRSDPTPFAARMGAGAAHLLLLGGALSAAVLAWHALTLGDAAPIGSDGMLGGLGAIWLVPSAYLAAWQVLSLRGLRGALAAAAVTTALSLGVFAAAFLLGLVSFGLLSLPVGAVGVVVIACVVARREAAETGVAPRRWPRVAGLLLAFAGLFPAFLGTIESVHAEIPPRAASGTGLAAMLLPYVLIFAPHAVLTLATRAPPPPPWRRGAVMVAAALLLPVPALGPAWIVALPGRIAAEHAERRLFVDAGGWGTGLHAGARLEAVMGSLRLEFTVPEGWLGLHPARRGPGLPYSIEIVPDPRQPPPALPIRRLRLASAFEVPMVPLGAAGPEHAAWRPLGCTVPDAAGMMLCRQLAFDGTGAPDAELAARLPEAALPRRVLARYGTGETGWLMLGPGMSGRCHARAVCRLRFAVPGGVEVEAEVPAEAGERWPEVREAVGLLLRQATGLELMQAAPAPF